MNIPLETFADLGLTGVMLLMLYWAMKENARTVKEQQSKHTEEMVAAEKKHTGEMKAVYDKQIEVLINNTQVLTRLSNLIDQVLQEKKV